MDDDLCAPVGATGPGDPLGVTGGSPPSHDSAGVDAESTPAVGDAPVAPEEEREIAKELHARRTVTESTLVAYKRDTKAFADWCDAEGRQSMPAPPDSVIEYLVRLLRDGRRPKGCLRVVSAINHQHQVAGLPPPCASSRAVLDELRKQVPEAFADRNHEESRTWGEEREATIELLHALGSQAPRLAKLMALLIELVRAERHLPVAVGVFFVNAIVAGEPQTLCRICGDAITAGRYATRHELEDHRCDV